MPADNLSCRSPTLQVHSKESALCSTCLGLFLGLLRCGEGFFPDTENAPKHFYCWWPKEFAFMLHIYTFWFLCWNFEQNEKKIKTQEQRDEQTRATHNWIPSKRDLPLKTHPSHLDLSLIANSAAECSKARNKLLLCLWQTDNDSFTDIHKLDTRELWHPEIVDDNSKKRICYSASGEDFRVQNCMRCDI